MWEYLERRAKHFSYFECFALCWSNIQIILIMSHNLCNLKSIFSVSNDFTTGDKELVGTTFRNDRRPTGRVCNQMPCAPFIIIRLALDGTYVSLHRQYTVSSAVSVTVLWYSCRLGGVAVRNTINYIYILQKANLSQ